MTFLKAFSNSFFLNQAREMLKRAIPALFGIIRKTAARKLSHLQMVCQAFAADAFPWTGIIGAIAVFHVLFFVAFHLLLLAWYIHFTFQP